MLGVCLGHFSEGPVKHVHPQVVLRHEAQVQFLGACVEPMELCPQRLNQEASLAKLIKCGALLEQGLLRKGSTRNGLDYLETRKPGQLRQEVGLAAQIASP